MLQGDFYSLQLTFICKKRLWEHFWSILKEFYVFHFSYLCYKIYLTISDLRPQLLSLDLGDCEFQDQQALVNTLTTLPCLRTLVLEGNPFTLASCYPGFTVDSLPRLSYLDTLQISPDERHRFRGLAKMSGEAEQCAALSFHLHQERDYSL